MSLSDIRTKQARVVPKPSKYRNQRCIVGQEKFDSKREAEFWMALKAREAAGEIRDLRRQIPWPLHCPTDGPDMEVCQYIADFQWCDSEQRLHVADAKGMRTRLFNLKAKWMLLEHGIAIELL